MNTFVLEITDEERAFLKESLRWAQQGFEERAAKYRYDPSLPSYYEDSYRPKLDLFREMQDKLNLENLKGKGV